MKPVIAGRSLAGVYSFPKMDQELHRRGSDLGVSCRETDGYNEYYGDMIPTKNDDILRLGFQNIGGVPTKAGLAKDDFLKSGINKFGFDLFGIAEVNVNWSAVPEDDRLINRSRRWWEHCQLTQAYLKDDRVRTPKQYGGVAMWSIGKVVHRIDSRGTDPHGLGRWVWVRYKGKQNSFLRVYTAYRPAIPQGGPFTVYAQQRTKLLSLQDDRCPRLAFTTDLCQELKEAIQVGDKVLLMLDGNESMLSSPLSRALQECQLKEVIIHKHFPKVEATVCNNESGIPIDGIWCSADLPIVVGGYLPAESLIPRTNHRTIWVDISLQAAFGQSVPDLVRPHMRKLQCRDPRSVSNFIDTYRKAIVENNLLSRAKELESKATFPLSEEDQRTFESLDALRCQYVEKAEQKCRKIKAGNVAFSPTIKILMTRIKAWNLLVKRAKGQKVSSRHLDRTLKKASLSTDEKIMGVEYLEERLRMDYMNYYTVKGNASQLRKDFLTTLAEAWAEKNKQDKANIYRKLLQTEKLRDTARRIKYIRGKLQMGSTSMIQVQDQAGQWKDVTDKVEMESAIMESTKKKYTASFGTPFMQPPLSLDVGYLGNGHATTDILDGKYGNLNDLDTYTQLFVQHLKQPESIKCQGDYPTALPLQSYQAFWKKAKERTSCYPGPLSFATLKAGSQDDTIAEFECIMTRIPLFSGYTPQRWKQCLDVMILKKAGLLQVDSLRTIVLFQPDCNYAFKFVGREMMRNAERHKTLAPEQFGSRKLHRAIDQATNKVLTFDILRQTRTPGAICANDAKSCYDLIVHPSAILAMRRQGVPQAVTTCMFNTLQEAKHQVRTAYGDSATSFGGNDLIPMHGVGQGNGAGPPIWAVVSSPILDMLRSAGLGSIIITAITLLAMHLSGFSFVDDTDTIQTARNNTETWQDVVQGLQRSLHHWEGGLRASGGAIVPGKTAWTLVAFKWKQGHWQYCTIDDTPCSLQVRDIDRQVHLLQRMESNQAVTSLGVDVAPDGNMQSQFNKLSAAATKWTTQMRAGRLCKQDGWVALTSTLWKTLTYPLQATSLSQEECRKIMALALPQALLMLGLCRNFPRILVHAPLMYQGLNIPHIYTIQEIDRLQALVNHTYSNTSTGFLFRAALENLILEVGVGDMVLDMPYLELYPLATASLLKQTWKFLDQNKITIIHDIRLPLFREGDEPLMLSFYKRNLSIDTLASLNRCRLFLHIYFVSELFSGSTSNFAPGILQGRQGPTLNSFRWPVQGDPGLNEWELWRHHLQDLRQRLHLTLGPWKTPQSKHWSYSTGRNVLYHRDNEHWKKFIPAEHHFRRGFYLETQSESPTENVFPAHVSQFQEWYVLHGFCNSEDRVSQVDTLQAHIQALPPEQRWCIDNIVKGPGNAEHIASCIATGTAVAVCDGSFKNGVGAAAWTIEGSESFDNWRGYTRVPGGPLEQSAYRSELVGILATVTMVQEICNFHKIQQGGITIACDGRSALFQAFDEEGRISIKAPDHDVISAIQRTIQRSPISWKYEHVYGHQDTTKTFSQLSRLEQLNCEMDELAKQALVTLPERLQPASVTGGLWSIMINGVSVIKNQKQRLYEHVHAHEVREYWKRKGKTGPDPAAVNWPTLGAAKSRVSKQRQWFTSKHASGMCGVGKFMHIWKEAETAACPRCGVFEDSTHVWKCQSVSSTELWQTLLQKLESWLMSKGTDPELGQAILFGLRQLCFPVATVNPTLSEPIQALFHQQEEIGWSSFLEGFHHVGWQDLQQNYYSALQSQRSGHQWAISLTCQLWDIAFALWEDRNKAMHNLSTPRAQDEIACDRSVRYLFQRLEGSLQQEDSYLFSLSLEDLLKKHINYKKEWKNQAQVVLARALDRAHEHRVMQERRALAGNRAALRRSDFTALMEQMSHTLQRWLQGHSTTR